MSEKELDAEIEALEKEVNRLGAELAKTKKDLAFYKAFYERYEVKAPNPLGDLLGVYR